MRKGSIRRWRWAPTARRRRTPAPSCVACAPSTRDIVRFCGAVAAWEECIGSDMKNLDDRMEGRARGRALVPSFYYLACRSTFKYKNLKRLNEKLHDAGMAGAGSGSCQTVSHLFF